MVSHVMILSELCYGGEVMIMSLTNTAVLVLFLLLLLLLLLQAPRVYRMLRGYFFNRPAHLHMAKKYHDILSPELLWNIHDGMTGYTEEEIDQVCRLVVVEPGVAIM